MLKIYLSPAWDQEILRVQVKICTPAEFKSSLGFLSTELKRTVSQATLYTRFIREKCFANYLGSVLQMNNSRGKGGGALLQGSYNEEESAQSFAQALMEWRNSGKEEKMQKNPTNAKSMRILFESFLHLVIDCS